MHDASHNVNVGGASPSRALPAGTPTARKTTDSDYARACAHAVARSVASPARPAIHGHGAGARQRHVGSTRHRQAHAADRGALDEGRL